MIVTSILRTSDVNSALSAPGAVNGFMSTFTTTVNSRIYGVSMTSFKAESTFVSYHNELHQAVDIDTFDAYSALWAKQHSTWIGIEDSSVRCPNSFYFPVCIDGVKLGSSPRAACPSYVCQEPTACDPVVPHDTIDYMPPVAASSLDDSTICTPPLQPPFLTYPSLGLDQGIPPYFTPLAIIPLKIYGKVTTTAGENCIPIPNAVVEAWHLDVAKLPLKGTVSDQVTPINLKDLSCRGSIETGDIGAFDFTTTVPAPYGPPRHINFKVHADGYETLITRIYFDADWRLHQTAPLEGESTESRRIKSKNTRTAGTLRGMENDDDTSQDEVT
jgi:hypothetical protein